MESKLSKKVLASGLLSATLMCSFVPMTSIASAVDWSYALSAGRVDIFTTLTDPNGEHSDLPPLMAFFERHVGTNPRLFFSFLGRFIELGADILKVHPCMGDRNFVDYAIWNERNDIACRALQFAIMENKIDVNATVRNNGDTPLHVAVRAGDVEAIDFMINKGANILAKNTAGESILNVAKATKNEALVKDVVSAQVRKNGTFDINDVEHTMGDTPLHWLVRNRCDASVIERAIAKGGSITAKNSVGEMPLSIAIGLDDYDLVICMLKKAGVRIGSDDSILDEKMKNYVATTAAQHGAKQISTKVGGKRTRSMEILEEARKLPIGERKAFIASHDMEYNFSERAVEIANGDSSEWYGVDFNVETRFLFTPLRSCLMDNWRAGKLLQFGADIDYQDRYGYTALHHEIINGYGAACVIWLLDHGARTDLEDYLGHTALYYLTHKEDGTKKDSDRIGDYVIKYCEKKGLTVPRD